MSNILRIDNQAMTQTDLQQKPKFTAYQTFVVGLLAFLQFSVILNFLIMSPLGALIMPAMEISPRQFGLIVSAYAFSAGISGLLMAGFADRYDRKKILLVFYTGFVAATVWCGLAQTFPMLLLARIVTGIFGGVIGSVVLAIAADLFTPQVRGRVMGVIQTAFAASQILGLPVTLPLQSMDLARAFSSNGSIRCNWRRDHFVAYATHCRAPQSASRAQYIYTLT